MTTEARTFATLAREPDEHQEEWLRKKLKARRRITALGEQALFESLKTSLILAFEQNQPLPGRDDLRQQVERLLVGDPPPSGGPLPPEATDHEVTAVVSGGLAAFLCEGEPSVARITAAASVESYVDLEMVAELISRSEASASWLSTLEKLKVDVQSINDDEFQASDELKRWQKELRHAIPAWHEGNFPHMDRSILPLVSAVLRALNLDSWLRFLDGLPIAALMETLLWYAHIDRAPEVLLDWTRRAPPAFDSAGERTTSALIFVLERRAFGLIERAATRYAWNEGSDGPSAITMTEQALNELTSAVRERSDGRTLLTELGARSLLMAQSSPAESKQATVRQEIQIALGSSYASAVGSLPQLMAACRARAAFDMPRSSLGFWLLAANRAVKEFGTNEDESRSVFRDGWPWLRELLRAGDPAVAGPYSSTAQWTERLAGLALAETTDPVAHLEEAWVALSSQRLARSDTANGKDGWAASCFLVRAAFFASHAERKSVGPALWTSAMTMAMTVWFARARQEPFAEVRYGLAHLAAGKLEVAGEPAQTLSFLVGELDEFADAILALLRNNFDPDATLEAASLAGMNAIAYLRLVRNKNKKVAIDEAIDTLTRAAGARPQGGETSVGEPSSEN